jgi:hypothetical protein
MVFKTSNNRSKRRTLQSETDVSSLHSHSILWVKEVQGTHIEKIHVAEIA